MTFEAAQFESVFAEELNQQLDKVLPYQPFEASRLDLALLSEAWLASHVRLEHVLDEVEAAEIQGGLARSIWASEFYSNEYPGEDWHEDSRIRSAVEYDRLHVSLSLMSDYGSSETREVVDVRFGSKDTEALRETQEFCLKRKLTQANAENYLEEAYDFVLELYKLKFISEDTMLIPSLSRIGFAVLDTYNLLDIDKAKGAWWAYLVEVVGVSEDLLGENGDVMSDTTSYLLGWTQKSIEKYIECGEFKLNPPTKEPSNGTGPFAAYGEDAAYFEELRRRREVKESQSEAQR